MIQKLTKIGFWAAQPDELLSVLLNVLDPLPDPRTLVDPDWEKADREKLAAYLDAGERVETFFGYSWCRFGCDNHSEMGTADLSDGVYLWPEGLSHYVRVHKVRLPEAFARHARKER